MRQSSSSPGGQLVPKLVRQGSSGLQRQSSSCSALLHVLCLHLRYALPLAVPAARLRSHAHSVQRQGIQGATVVKQGVHGQVL